MLSLHPSLSFTMELPVDDRIPFIGIEIFKNGTNLETQVFRKSTNTGALLHFHSQDGWILAKFLFCVFMDRDKVQSPEAWISCGKDESLG